MDRPDQIGAAPWNLGFSVDLVSCGLVLGIIGRGPVPAANVSLCFSLAMARPLRQGCHERHKTTERLARRQALGGHDAVVREAKVPVQARHAETCNPPMTHAMPSPSSHPRRRLIQSAIQQSYMLAMTTSSATLPRPRPRAVRISCTKLRDLSSAKILSARLWTIPSCTVAIDADHNPGCRRELWGR
jgi:hypothetical protein